MIADMSYRSLGSGKRFGDHVDRAYSVLFEHAGRFDDMPICTAIQY